MKDKDIIKLEAMSLGIADSIRIVCPFCNGTHEKSMKITRHHAFVSYSCFRASCKKRGAIGSLSDYNSDINTSSFKPDTCSLPTTSLPKAYYSMLYNLYGITPRIVRQHEFKYIPAYSRLYMPVFDVSKDRVGEVTKRVPSLSGCNKPSAMPKAAVYWTKDVPKLYFPLRRRKSRTVILVEDILSCLSVVTRTNTDSIALLGTYMDAAMAEVIGNEYDNVVLALDADATAVAINMFNTYSLYWQESSVVALTKDPKDMTISEIRQTLRVF